MLGVMKGVAQSAPELWYFAVRLSCACWANELSCFVWIIAKPQTQGAWEGRGVLIPGPGSTGHGPDCRRLAMGQNAGGRGRDLDREFAGNNLARTGLWGIPGSLRWSTGRLHTPALRFEIPIGLAMSIVPDYTQMGIPSPDNQT